jgi:hypothetical protein
MPLVREPNFPRGESKPTVLSRINLSLLIVGLILLHSTQGLFFAFGNQMRLLTLAAGFALILGATVLRARSKVVNHLQFIGATLLIAGVLLGIEIALDHAHVGDFTTHAFQVVAVTLFMAGYLLAKTKERGVQGEPYSWAVLGAIALSVFASAALLRFVGTLGAERGYAETELNPVGAAYAHMALAVLFFCLLMLSRSYLVRGAAGVGGVLATYVVISSASRGAVVWGILAMVFVLYKITRQKELGIKTAAIGFAVAVFAVGAISVLGMRSEVLDERFVTAIGRFESLYYDLIGKGHDDSFSARQAVWSAYKENPGGMFPFGEKGYTPYPHNQWVEFLARWGLAGLPLLAMSFWCLWQCTRRLISRENLDFETFVILALFLFGYLQSISSLSLEMNRVMWLGFGYLVALGGFEKPTSRAQYSGRSRRARSLPRQPAWQANEV